MSAFAPGDADTFPDDTPTNAWFGSALDTRSRKLGERVRTTGDACSLPVFACDDYPAAAIAVVPVGTTRFGAVPAIFAGGEEAFDRQVFPGRVSRVDAAGGGGYTRVGDS